MKVTDVKLLFGPYRPPRLRRGDRAFCLYRDCVAVITGLSDARTPWPRCVPLRKRTGRSGLLVDEELARAVRHESCAAVAYWWGVNQTTVIRWRKALEVTRTNNQGSHRLILGAIQATLDARFGRRSRHAPRGRTAVWTPKEVALLGVLPDPAVARRTGRSVSAVGKKRLSLGRPPLADGPDGPRLKYWTAADDQAVRTLQPEAAARRTGRSLRAVNRRRAELGLTAR